MRVELLVGRAHQRFGHDAVTIFVLGDQLVAQVGSDDQPRVFAIPGAAANDAAAALLDLADQVKTMTAR